MRPRQITQAHQELTDDLAAGEGEGPAEQLDPFLLCQRMVLAEPGGKGSVRPTQADEPRRIGDRGIDLETIADDPGIREQRLQKHHRQRGRRRR